MDFFYYRKLTISYFLYPAVGVVAGYAFCIAFSMLIIGPGNFLDYIHCLSKSTHSLFAGINFQRIRENLQLLYHSGQWPVALIGITYGVWQSRNRDLTSLRRILLPIFAAVSFLFFFFFGLPWPRYLYPALLMALLCCSLVINDVVLEFRSSKLFPFGLLATVFLIIIGGLLFSRLATNLKSVLYEKDNSAEYFATLVDKTVPEEAVILNWEWEIEFYSNRIYTHPPFELFQALVDLFYNDISSPVLEQRRISDDIDYIIIGPMARITEAYNAELSQRETELITEIGPYQLIKLSSSVESGIK